jgi:hypothetical protein
MATTDLASNVVSKSQDIVSFILRLIVSVVESFIDTGTGTCRRPLNSRMDILVDTKNISVLCQFKSPPPNSHVCTTFNQYHLY